MKACSVPPTRTTATWRTPTRSGRADATVRALVPADAQLCWEVGFPAAPETLPLYWSGERTDVFDVFPELEFYRDNLESAMRAETEAFFRHLLDENLSTRNFLSADYSFLNRELALHYGIEGVQGNHLRRVSRPPGAGRCDPDLLARRGGGGARPCGQHDRSATSPAMAGTRPVGVVQEGAIGE